MGDVVGKPEGTATPSAPTPINRQKIPFKVSNFSFPDIMKNKIANKKDNPLQQRKPMVKISRERVLSNPDRLRCRPKLLSTCSIQRYFSG